MKKNWNEWLDFTLALTQRELKGRYKHVALGFLWIVANPLLQMLVIGLIFQFFSPFPTEDYFLYLFLGLLPWNFFTASFSRAVPLFVYERHLIKKAAFPRESLIFSLILANLFHCLLGLMLALPFVKQFVDIPLFLGATAWIFVFTAGISLLFSSLNVRFRDADFFVKAVLPLWFYATPIMYPLSILPQEFQTILSLNPLTPIISLFRASFGVETGQGAETYFWPLLITVAIALIGFLIFKKEEKYFDDWI